jgi:acyl-CoA thioester hydrolase
MRWRTSTTRFIWAERIGMPLRNDGEGMILAKASVTFKKPVSYPASVTVDLLAGNIGRTSFTLLNTLTVEGETEPAATGECVIVWYDYINQKSVPLPEKLRAILQGKA